MQIHLAKSDISDMAVDAIVNPANSLGIMGGGVAAVLSRKGGPLIQREVEVPRLLFPWDIPEDFDFEAHFFDIRPWFFSVITFAWCVDIPETVLKSEVGLGLRNLPTGYVVLIGVQLSLSALGIFWSNRTFHKFFAIFWPIFTVGYLSITTLAQIAT